MDKIHAPQLGPRSMQSSTNTSDENAKLRTARDAAHRLLSGFPDYSKTPPEYLLAIVEALASFPDSIIDRIADRRHGLPAMCRFLPVVADVVAMGTDLMDREAKRTEATRRFQARGEPVERHDPPRASPERIDEILASTGFPKHGGKPLPPEWITTPDPQAAWRKQGPPSPQLLAVMAAQAAANREWLDSLTSSRVADIEADTTSAMHDT